MNIEYLRPASLRAVGFTSRKPADLFYKNHQRIPRGKPLDIIYCDMPLVLCFLFSALCRLPSVLCFPPSDFDSLCSLSSDLWHPSSVFYPLSLSGNSRRISSSVALQIPLSVIKPVTNFAGVTSKAKLAA